MSGTLAHTYVNEHVCIFARVVLEGCVTLAKMAGATPHIEKQRLPRKEVVKYDTLAVLPVLQGQLLYIWVLVSSWPAARLVPFWYMYYCMGCS